MDFSDFVTKLNTNLKKNKTPAAVWTVVLT